jgi:hypothetical protein
MPGDSPLDKLSLGDKIIAGSAIGLFIFSFFPWFKLTVPGISGVPGLPTVGSRSVSFSGWDVGFLWAGLPVIIGLAMLAVVAVKAFSPETKLPDLPVAWGQAMLIAGGLAALLVLLKLLTGYHSVDRAFGLFLSALCAIGLAVGGFFKMQEEDGSAAPSAGTAPPTPF